MTTHSAVGKPAYLFTLFGVFVASAVLGRVLRRAGWRGHFALLASVAAGLMAALVAYRMVPSEIYAASVFGAGVSGGMLGVGQPRDGEVATDGGDASDR